MKKITFNNIFWIFLIVIIVYQIYNYSKDYFVIKNYQYGEKYNAIRQKNRIPIIDSEMEPFKMPVDNNWGMIWVNENIPKKEKPLIHRIKIIDASDKNGWNNESDSYRYFINDTLNYVLNIKSIKSANKINFEYNLGKTDSRKINFEDYQENKHYDYNEKKLNLFEFDSIKSAWKIQ